MLRKIGKYLIIIGGILIPVMLVLLFTDLISQDSWQIILFLLCLILFFLGFSFLHFNSEPKVRRKKMIWYFIISLFIILVGLNLKVNHLKGANICVVIGSIMLSFSFFPLLVKHRFDKWKTFTANSIHTLVVSICDLLSLISIICGILFKFMKWPGATWLFICGVVLFLISFLAWNQIFRYSLRKTKENEDKLADAFRQLHLKHEIIEEKNKEITDSINYAKRIQSALLPSENDLKNIFPESFILFKPKDIVSGDFYWMTKTENYFFYATADCTGHGVPGGFMSMLGCSFLNEIIVENKIHEPAEVLNRLREKVIHALKQTGSSGENKDGMDIVLARINHTKNEMTYAAANNEFYLIRNGEMQFFAPDKQPVGFYSEQQKPFSQKTIELLPEDSIYTFTDGYADQFGGEKGKKLKYKNLEQLLLVNHKHPFEQQKSEYDLFIEKWKGELEQNDDICLIGIKI